MAPIGLLLRKNLLQVASSTPEMAALLLNPAGKLELRLHQQT
jgi:hypothetical protein